MRILNILLYQFRILKILTPSQNFKNLWRHLYFTNSKFFLDKLIDDIY